MRDHWWWRPGWKVGRRMYTWHFTFDGQADLHRLVREYQERLEGLPGLDPVPERWLHLTTQGLGFVEEMPDGVVNEVVDKVRSRLVGVPPVSVGVGPAIVDPEVVRLRVQPAAALVLIRTAIREVIAEVTGSVGESQAWNPHISVAYSSAEGPLAPAAAVLADELPPVQVTIERVQLIVLGRDEHCYTWDTKATVVLGG